jgi:1,2-diacylglycerol 3-beta-galactosyltransferase
MTDIADFPPNFWMERQPQYLVCGSARAMEQARLAGYAEAQLRQASGMILQPHFYENAEVDVAAARQELGLEPDLATALVLFGGHGAQVMEDIYERLQDARLPMQGIFICGRNERLARDLAKRKGRMPLHVVGFTREVPRFMRLADFFIGKPGPGSISEAIHMNLPVIVQRNAWTLPQERYNTDWVQQHNVGVVLRGFREVARAVGHLLEAGRLEELRSNAKSICNRAVFEVPELMADMMERGPARDQLSAECLARLR